MTRRLVLQDDVITDLEEISAYIAEDSPIASARFVEQALELAEMLLDMPGTGSLRDFGEPALAGLRVVFVPGFRNYGPYYLTTNDAVVVLRVLHGSRDLGSIFAPARRGT